MNEINLAEAVEMGGIFTIPGEGFVVELRLPSGTYMFDKQGLQHRITEKQRQGYDAAVEQRALTQINSLGPVIEKC